MHFSWVVEFPMFDYDDEEKRWAAMHHPFTAPRDQDFATARDRPGQVPGEGVRPGDQRLRSGRRHDPDSRSGDSAAGVSTCWASTRRRPRSGSASCCDALQYGAPPHGGIALGHRPLGDALRRAGQHPRLHRLPQDAAGDRPDDRRPGPGRSEAAQRAGDQARHVAAAFSPALTPRLRSGTITGFTGEKHDASDSLPSWRSAGSLAVVGCGRIADATSRSKLDKRRRPTSRPSRCRTAKPIAQCRQLRPIERPGRASGLCRTRPTSESAEPATVPPVLLSKQHEALCRVKVGDAMPEIELPKVRRRQREAARLCTARRRPSSSSGRATGGWRSTSWPTSGRTWSRSSARAASTSSASP